MCVCVCVCVREEEAEEEAEEDSFVHLRKACVGSQAITGTENCCKTAKTFSNRSYLG